MNLLTIFTIVVVLSAALAYVNERFLHLPSTVGLMILALVLSLVLQLGGIFSKEVLGLAERLVESIDFSEALLDFMLSFLLFAGALHTDWSKLNKSRRPIITFATAGVVLSTFLAGTGVFLLLSLFKVTVPYFQCLVFGALISPTDPIAVLGILKKARVPESTEIKIVGESLFNDGIGVVLFITLLRITQRGLEKISLGEIGLLLLEEVAGGIILGLALGYLGFRLLKSIDHYQTEVLITIGMVMGGYLLAKILQFSGPLAMVTAGILIGNKGKETAMSNVTMDYTFKFWEMVDEIMNAALFVLIGLELLIIPFQLHFVWLGMATIVLVLLTRHSVLALVSIAFGFKSEFEPSTISIMTWGGLRGGISIAMALIIPIEFNRSLFLTITYVIVLFSIIVQGLTIEHFIKRRLNRSA
ncbi:MAG TPA: sodium:proton antiporter [Cyclobacteriaceae bacterium]|nr:sodium:proton antiporter [Cyclobacteriaceae bacterium]